MGLQESGASKKLIDTPCGPAYAASLKCLDKHGYDKSKCKVAFDEYKKCKREQLEAEKAERLASRKGLFS